MAFSMHYETLLECGSARLNYIKCNTMEIRHDKNGKEMLRNIYRSQVLFHARKHSGIALKVILFCGTQWKDISISVLRMQTSHLSTIHAS